MLEKACEFYNLYAVYYEVVRRNEKNCTAAVVWNSWKESLSGLDFIK